MNQLLWRTYSRNSLDDTLEESNSLHKEKKKKQTSQIDILILCRESPKANMARPPANEIDDKDKTKFGRNINQ